MPLFVPRLRDVIGAGPQQLEFMAFFLPREAMLSAVFAVVVCLCVCHTLVLYQNGYT